MIKNYKPYFNIGPGPFIKEELEARNWKEEDLAAILTELNRILAT